MIMRGQIDKWSGETRTSICLKWWTVSGEKQESHQQLDLVLAQCTEWWEGNLSLCYFVVIRWIIAIRMHPQFITGIKQNIRDLNIFFSLCMIIPLNSWTSYYSGRILSAFDFFCSTINIETILSLSRGFGNIFPLFIHFYICIFLKM